MTSQSSLSRSRPRRSKRAQSQRLAHDPEQPQTPAEKQRRVRFSLPAVNSSQNQRSKTLKVHPVNSQREALNRYIRVCNQRKRRTRFFNQVSLCIVTVCMGKNIMRKLSTLEGASTVWGWGETFQSHKKDPNVNYLWPESGRNLDGIYGIPSHTLQPFGAYPNILNITPEMRQDFHPLVKMPQKKRRAKKNIRKDYTGTCTDLESRRHRIFRWPWRKRRKHRRDRSKEADLVCTSSLEVKTLNETYDYEVRDFTDSSRNDGVVLLEGEIQVPQLVSSREQALEYARLPKGDKKFDIGRYDEDRQNMYTSDLFLLEDEEGGGETTRRTLHVGLDVGAPVGTPVYAFTDGVVHSAGYNPELGDYGHVVVVEHVISGSRICRKGAHDGEEGMTKVYALYGHLGAKSGKGKYPGQTIKKGQVVGYVGDVDENGGWTGTHLHFQLAVHPPEKHDMPGAVAMANREEALLEYVDPRYVVGELY